MTSDFAARFSDIQLHAATAIRLQQFLVAPSHAVILYGPAGMGKKSIVAKLAAEISSASDDLENQPYVRLLRPDTKTSTLPIESIRNLSSFLSLKVAGNTPRVIVINDAHSMTTEAQNALLKTLEEPVPNSYLLLTASHEQALLPTIRSRAQVIQLQKPPTAELSDYFARQGYSLPEINKTLLMSGGLPGLAHALLSSDDSHPLAQAANTAREIIQKTTFERLALVDKLSKDKQLSLDTLQIMQQMAHIALGKGSNAKPWHKLLKQSYQTTDELLSSAQPKLALTNLMVNL